MSKKFREKFNIKKRKKEKFNVLNILFFGKFSRRNKSLVRKTVQTFLCWLSLIKRKQRKCWGWGSHF